MAKVTPSLKLEEKLEEKKADDTQEAPTHYQEWVVNITYKDGAPHAEWVKISRPVVKITDEQAAILNEGVLRGSNNYAKMYFKPE